MIGPGKLKFAFSQDAKRNHQRQEDDRFQKILDRFVGPVDESIKQIRAEMVQQRQERIAQLKNELAKATLNEYHEIWRQANGDRAEGTAKLRQEYAEQQDALRAELAELQSMAEC